MPVSCCAYGCTQRGGKDSSTRFFRFPEDPALRRQWEAAVKRQDWKATPYTRICGYHFITGEPNYDHSEHPDYVPSLRLDGKENDTPAMLQKIKRYERAQNHKILKSASRQSSSRKEDNVEQRQQTKSLTEENDSLKVQVASLTAEVASLTAEVELLKADAGTQVSALQKEVQLLKDRPMSVDFIKGDDKRTKFYTGLTTFFLFTTIFDFVVPQVLMLQKMPGKLTLMDEFLMVLMKLRLNLLNEDLGYRFGVASSTVSRNFHKWLEVMYMRLKPMIRWPDKETVHKTLPNCFKKHY